MIKKLPFRSIQNWSFIIIIVFFILSFLNPIFGLFGFVCMFVPLILAFAGYGKAHCSHVCPRGSFFGKVLTYVSLKRKALPAWMRKTWVKHTLLIWMISMFTLSVARNFQNPTMLGAALFRMMFGSFVVGALLGIFFKPRSWCQICPMGHGADLIKKAKA